MPEIVFSIIIPCHNHGNFLPDALNSLIEQSFTNWEAIVINDGSTDNSREVVKSYGEIDKRIQLFNQSNQGLSASRNVGISNSSGRYLIFLDADDWLEPNALESFAKAVDLNPNFELYRCGYAYRDQPNLQEYHVHRPIGDGEIFPNVLTHNLGPCNSILIKRYFAEKIDGFDCSLKCCEDWDFWIRAGKMGAKIHSIPEVLAGYRFVFNSMSRNPHVMYDALKEVSRRAGLPDSRLPKDLPYNKSIELDYPFIQKKHLIRMLGVMLHQGKVREAVDWFSNEKKVWNWTLTDTDWIQLSNYLSWRYFFEPEQIEQLLEDTAKYLIEFFTLLGYSPKKILKLIRMIFEPQLKRRNHQRYGRLFGATLNKLSWY